MIFSQKLTSELNIDLIYISSGVDSVTKAKCLCSFFSLGLACYGGSLVIQWTCPYRHQHLLSHKQCLTRWHRAGGPGSLKRWDWPQSLYLVLPAQGSLWKSLSWQPQVDLETYLIWVQIILYAQPSSVRKWTLPVINSQVMKANMTANPLWKSSVANLKELTSLSLVQCLISLSLLLSRATFLIQLTFSPFFSYYSWSDCELERCRPLGVVTDCGHGLLVTVQGQCSPFSDHLYPISDFPSGSVIKNLSASAGDTRDSGSIL